MGRPRVIPWAAWRRSAPGKARFRLYTRLTLQVSLVFVVVTTAVSMANAGNGPWPVVAVIACAVAAAAAVEAQPLLATVEQPRLPRPVLGVSATTLAVVWLTSAVILLGDPSDSVAGTTRVCLLFAALYAVLSVIAFLPHSRGVTLVISVVSGLAVGIADDRHVIAVAVALLLGGFTLGTMQFTIWSLQLIDEVERSKEVEAQLQLAEERLSFARDLHDVVGRAFSAIAVKSELAATLARSGASERAGSEMDEVKTLATDSMEEMRSLVRGYRAPSLSTEVAGAQALLQAAGCVLAVEGDPDAVPEQVREAAAWAVREGTTNIVRHSSATRATLTLGRSGMSLRNNGVQGPSAEHSGLRGLAERLSTVSASLDTYAERDQFTLEIHWGAP